jgi:hypothetical protein
LNNVIVNKTLDAQNYTIYTEIDLISNNVLTSWNGIRADGSNAASSSLMNGEVYPPYDRVPAPITSGAVVAA